MKKIVFIAGLGVILAFVVQVGFLNVNPDDLSCDTVNYVQDAIDYVKAEGIAGGYPDGSFRPDNKINRAAFTKIIIGSKFDANEIENCVSSKSFSDVPASEWFAPYICVAANNNIVKGYSDGTFKPANNISFVAAAKIIVNTFGYETGTAEIWYQPFVEKLEEKNAIPVSIYSFEGSITRGEMAEMIYRLKENIEDRPSAQFFTGDSELVSSTTFIKAYRFYDNNHGWGVWPTKDNNYIFTGWTIVGFDSDAFISKINRQGELIWTKLIGSRVHYSGPMGQGRADDEGYLVTQLKDGSYLLAGQTNGYVGDAEAEIFETATDVFLSKFDQQGNYIWTETVGDLAGDTPVSLYPTDDGGFLLLLTLGELNAGAAEVGDEDHYFALIKFDANGQKEWIKKTNLNIGGTMGDRQQVNFFIERENDGGFALIGTIPFDEVLKTKDEEIGSHMPSIVKMDKNGKVKWAKSIEVIPKEYLIAEPADNELGYIERYVKARWAAGNFSAVQRTPDNGYLVIGLLSPDVKGYAAYNFTYKTITGTPLLAVKFDKNGKYKWAKTIETGLLSFDQEFRIAKTEDGDFVIMRNFMSKGDGFIEGSWDTYMEKMEKVYRLSSDGYMLGDEKKNPALKEAIEEMNKAQDFWAADMTNHISLIKVDPEFNVKWMKTIGPEVIPVDVRSSTGTPYEFKGSDIRIDNDQGIIIAGTHGTDIVCSVSFGVKFYCNDALLIKLDNKGNLSNNSALVSDYRTVSQEDLSQYIIIRDVEPKVLDYELGIKKQEPSVSAKTAKAITTLSPFEENMIISGEQESVSSIATPETTPKAKTQALIYYEYVESVETENEISREVHDELMPIFNELFNNRVKLRDNFGGISMDYVFGRLVTEEDILAVQVGLEELGYTLAMDLENGKLVMSKIGRVLNLGFSITNRTRGTLSVTW